MFQVLVKGKIEDKARTLISQLTDSPIVSEPEHGITTVAMGAEAIREMFKGAYPDHKPTGITPYKVDGEAFWSAALDAWVVCSLHPSFVFGENPDLVENIREALGRAENMPAARVADVDFTWARDSMTANLWFDQHFKSGAWALDTETVSLDDLTLLMLQLSNGESTISIDAGVIPVQRVVDAFASDWYSFIMHNAGFDLRVLHQAFGVIPKHIEDTMALAMCTRGKERGLSLKKLAGVVNNFEMYEHEIRQHLPKADSPFSLAPPDILAVYGACDAVNTYNLYENLRKGKGYDRTRFVYEKLLVPNIVTGAQIQEEGIKVNSSYFKAAVEEWRPRWEKAVADIQSYARDNGYDGDINPNSPNHLRELMFGVLMIEPSGRTKTGAWRTDSHFIEARYDHEAVKLLKKFRDINTIAKYLGCGTPARANEPKGLDKYIVNGRVHPQVRLEGTRTGRRTISNPAMQTLPREDTAEDKGKSIKRIFVPDDGYVWFSADYATLEMRIALHMSGDEGLAEALDAEDFHTAVASMVFNKPQSEIDKTLRTYAKGVSFGILYGIQAESLAAYIGGDITRDQAEKYITEYKRTFPKLTRMMGKLREEGLRTGQITTEVGRVRRWYGVNRTNRYSIANQMANAPIQSLGGDLTLYAFKNLDAQLRAKRIGNAFVDVHDSILGQIKRDSIEEGVLTISQQMSKPPFSTEVQFPVDIEIGDNWGDVKKVEI